MCIHCPEFYYVCINQYNMFTFAWPLVLFRPINLNHALSCQKGKVKGKMSICIAHLVDQPPLMRSLITNRSRLTTQTTAQPAHTDWAATRPLARQRQSAVGLHLCNPSLMDYYSFNRPQRDGRLSRPCWLTDTGCFTHKVVTQPAISLAQG